VLFQTLDDKSECVGIFCDDKLYFEQDHFPTSLSKTWKFAPYLRGLDVEYASLYLEGRPIKGAIPEYLEDDWGDVSLKIEAFKRSLKQAKVDLDENCFYDLVPRRFLIDLCRVKNKITEHVLKTVSRPKRYEFYKHVSMLVDEISHRRVAIDERKLKSYENISKFTSYVSSMRHFRHVKYNQFGTKTGRLTTTSGSFPILTLPKDLRSAILPTNDYYLELDFNGAEVRTLLGLLGKEQPPGDVHDFHLHRVFTETQSREDAKVAFFAWLYGSSQQKGTPAARRLEEFYPKQDLLKEYYRNNNIVTPYGRVMTDVSDHHAVNYLVQATAAELFLKQALKIDYLLRAKTSGSRIAFLLHDAIIIDMKDEDSNLVSALCHLMASTNFGTFGINIKRGFSLGTLKQWIR
tara:strand:+ start:1231 stop:2445 length:1215 start_codon:yes stop_codon:yes gene_type:complete